MSVRAVAMFQAIGFESQVLRRHHVWLGGDEPHDLMVVLHHIGDTRAELVTPGVAKVLS